VLFNSLTFLVFFPLALLGFFAAPARFRYIYLLVVSFAFYAWWNPMFIFLLLTTILITYIGSHLVAAAQRLRTKRIILAVALILDLGILIYFKYADWLISLCQRISSVMHLGVTVPSFDIILPVGISFFTFHALSYIIDCYRGNFDPEPNIGRYALFVSFFPLMVAGPIERSQNLLRQIENMDTYKAFDYHDLRAGLFMMLQGFFMKVVISDRIATLVNTVYNSYWNYGSIELIIATVAFAIQIYTDFCGYSLIAYGSSRMMGFHVRENFDTPYFARSVREFWRRWHISLSTWFRDYVYISLGGNRKGKPRKYLNTMVTFVTSGLWHGANLTFLTWGFLHGAYQVIGDIIAPVRERVCRALSIKKDAFSTHFLQTLWTFAIVCFAWIFFRANSIGDVAHILQTIFTQFDPWVLFDGTLFKLGLDSVQFTVLVVALLILVLLDCIKYFNHERLDQWLSHQNAWFSIAVFTALLFFTIIYGAYGPTFTPQAFIYFRF
jgi:D-alanyl-lipoteichoic acid acyltransferase DltB (MBOAT superfamily)